MLGFRFESETEKRNISSSAQQTDRSRLLFEEVLEMDFKGSIYHPNLASFDINLENGMEQVSEKFQPNLTGKLKNNSLNRFHILTSFLRQKPYAFSLLADKSRRIQNREFFERQIIDSTRYGGNFGLKNDYVPVNLSFNNDSRVISRAFRPSQEYVDNEISSSLSNENDVTGESNFDFTHDRFSRTESGTPDQKGASDNFNLFNQKYLSKDSKKTLSSFLRFYRLTGTSSNSIFNLDERLDMEHTDYLDSLYGYSFSNMSSGGIETKNNRISAGVRHRLYESLTSSFNTYYFNSDATTFSQDSYDLSFNEDYVKKIGKIGRLSAGLGLGYNQEKRKTPENILSMIDESHTLSGGVITLLNTPDVITGTVVVTDSTGTITYALNVDYQLISAGSRTQIQRIAAGVISDGQVVLVDYQANSSPLLKFNTLRENYRFRIDFLDDLIGIFYRLDKETHPSVSGGDSVILQTLKDTSVGLDFNYKNLKVELENEDYNSNLSPYKRLRLTESFFFNPTTGSTLTFQSSQSKIRLISSQATQKFFEFITRYSVRLNQYIRFNTEGGFRRQDGTGIDLNDVTVRSGFELSVGKFQMNAEYDFEKQLYLGDSLVNHFFFTKIRRTF